VKNCDKSKTAKDMIGEVKTSFRVKNVSPVGEHSSRMKIPSSELPTVGFTISPEDVDDLVLNLLLCKKAKQGAIVTVYRKGTSDGKYQMTVIGSKK
jgi:hypothetical protein